MISIDFTPPMPPEAWQLDTDVTCRKCKYNLRGLASNSNCPECGTPVDFSTRGDVLHNSDPAWVDGLQSGILCIVWGTVFTIVSMVVAFILKVQYLGIDLSIAATLVSTGAAILHVYGAWMLTAPDPSGLGEDRYGTSRKLIRITLLIGVLQHLVRLATLSMTLPPTFFWATIYLALAAALASLVGLFAMLNYLAKLARRFPDENLARRAERTMWEFGIPLSVVAFFGLLAFASAGQSVAIMLLFSCAVFLFLVAALIVGMRYLAFLATFAGELGTQTEIARQAWQPARVDFH